MDASGRTGRPNHNIIIFYHLTKYSGPIDNVVNCCRNI